MSIQYAGYTTKQNKNIFVIRSRKYRLPVGY